MAPSDIWIFAITLFLALCALLMWKRRRDLVHIRMNQKLRGYMSVQDDPRPENEDGVGESIVRVA